MAFKRTIVVQFVDPANLKSGYLVTYLNAGDSSPCKKIVDYDTAMLILGAEEQGRKKIKAEIRKLLMEGI